MRATIKQMLDDCLAWEAKGIPESAMPEKFRAMSRAMCRIANYIRTGEHGLSR